MRNKPKIAGGMEKTMRKNHAQRGFSMIELLIASMVLLFGVAAVVQLVPNAMQANLRSRQDSTAVVMAERVLDQMISQPLNSTTFTNSDGQVCSLGSAAAAGFVGHAVINSANRATINFGVNAITPGYGYNWSDPNDPNRAVYEVRWAVMTRAFGTSPAHKRFVVGVWKRSTGGRNVQPVTIEAAVGR